MHSAVYSLLQCNTAPFYHFKFHSMAPFNQPLPSPPTLGNLFSVHITWFFYSLLRGVENSTAILKDTLVGIFLLH